MNFDALFSQAESAAAATGSSFPRIDVEGMWVCKVTEAIYGKNQAGTASRGQVKLEVIENRNDSADRITARTNAYITVASKDELTVRSIAPWIKTLLDLGVSQDKIKDDAVDFTDIVQNIITILTKQLKLGKEVKVILVTKADGKGGFYKNVGAMSNYKSAPVDPVDNAPAPEVDPFA